MPKDQVAVVYGEEDNTFMAVRSMPMVYEQGNDALPAGK